jgi:Protein of unknown function (DUF434)
MAFRFPSCRLPTRKTELPMTESWPNLPEAAADFRFLLARGYPRKAALALVGNRYGLDEIARRLLHRGVFAPEVAVARRAKLRQLPYAGRLSILCWQFLSPGINSSSLGNYLRRHRSDRHPSGTEAVQMRPLSGNGAVSQRPISGIYPVK